MNSVGTGEYFIFNYLEKRMQFYLFFNRTRSRIQRISVYLALDGITG